MKSIILKSIVFKQKDIYLYDYLDLYSFTHDMFFAFNFGKTEVNSIFSQNDIKEIWDKSIKNYYYSILSKNYDLAAEFLIVLLITGGSQKKVFINIFKEFYKYICEPILNRDYDFSTDDYTYYHCIRIIRQYL